MHDPKRLSFQAKVWNIFATYGAAWLWVCVFVTAMSAAAGATAAAIPPLSVAFSWAEWFPPIAQYLRASPGATLFMGLIFAPVFEEAVFRLLPLTLVGDKSPEKVRAVQIAVCGILFGIIHGHPINVFIQGFVGYMLGVLYMKNRSSQFTAYISCVFVHAAYNFTVLVASNG